VSAVERAVSTEHPRPPVAGALRWVALVLVAAAFAGSVLERGVPFDREQIMAWALVAAVVVLIGSRASLVRGLVRDWLPFLVLLTLYDRCRGIADKIGAPLQVQLPAAFDRFLFGTEPSVTLQRFAYSTFHISWWEVPVALVYVSHYFVAFVVAVVLWVRSRERWLAFVVRLLALTALALVTYLLLPTVPPWLAAQSGSIGPVERVAARGWTLIGLSIARHLIENGQGSVNLVAAVPSLHAGYAALLCVFAWPRARCWLRALLLSYALSMAFVLVLTGEHYVFDIVVAWVYVGVVEVAGRRFDRWRAVRVIPPEATREPVGSHPTLYR
jgi:hypothetical protein